LLASVSSQAASISVTDSPTVGQDGFTTFTLTANADPTEKIIGFNFVGDGSLGFTGPMSHVMPIGMSTVFSDLNGFFTPPADVSQDSQFKVQSTKGLAVSASESANHLRGAFNYTAANILTDASDVWAFAQIATNDMVEYIGDLTIRNGNGEDRLERFQGVLGGGGGEEFAPIAVDLDLGERIQGAIISHIFTTSEGTPPISWGDLEIVGPAPANAPTLTSDGNFSWNSHGSPFGAYTFNATATNDFGSDTGSLTVELVIPEPATMTLFGLAMIGLVGFARRRS